MVHKELHIWKSGVMPVTGETRTTVHVRTEALEVRVSGRWMTPLHQTSLSLSLCFPSIFSESLSRLIQEESKTSPSVLHTANSAIPNFLPIKDLADQLMHGDSEGDQLGGGVFHGSDEDMAWG